MAGVCRQTWCSQTRTISVSKSLIVLTTDFGVSSSYAGVLHGVIAGINPAAQVIDLTHAIRPQNVREAAVVLADSVPYFPPGTIHVAVVDPGVGTQRALLYAELAGQYFLAPDNGLLSRLWQRHSLTRLLTLDRPEYWLQNLSATFHGRDILAPVAAHLSRGVAPTAIGTPREERVELEWPLPACDASQIAGCIEWIDSFGNLATNIPAELLAAAPRDDRLRVQCASIETRGLCRTYGERHAGEWIAIFGSYGRLELAIVNGNAAAASGSRCGDPVNVAWS